MTNGSHQRRRVFAVSISSIRSCDAWPGPAAMSCSTWCPWCSSARSVTTGRRSSTGVHFVRTTEHPVAVRGDDPGSQAIRCAASPGLRDQVRYHDQCEVSHAATDEVTCVFEPNSTFVRPVSVSLDRRLDEVQVAQVVLLAGLRPAEPRVPVAHRDLLAPSRRRRSPSGPVVRGSCWAGEK